MNYSKVLVLMVSMISSGNLFTSEYQCDLEFYKGEASVGKTTLTQQFGNTFGRLHEITLSKKRNVLGKVVWEQKLELSGAMQLTQNESTTFLEATLDEVTYSSRRGVKSERKHVVEVKATGDAHIEASENGYSVRGVCEMAKDECAFE